MTPEEQGSISTLNNFFCGMHLLVGMADVVSSVLLQWETMHFAESAAAHCTYVRKSKSGVVRLIRTACKALCRHGSEQSGVYQSFTSHLATNGIKRNPLASFRGNRFNILFYDAGAVYYISDVVVSFFLDIWRTPNQLLRAVYSDMQVPEYLAGCRALGLINKVVTGPLWRVLESSDISILEMNGYYQTLITNIDLWSLDASELLHGEAVLYPDFPPTEDAIWHHLIAPASSENDATTQEIIQLIFHAFSALLTRLVSDHLPGGVYDNPSAQLEVETGSAPNTNAISECDFAKLDRCCVKSLMPVHLHLKLWCYSQTTKQPNGLIQSHRLRSRCYFRKPARLLLNSSNCTRTEGNKCWKDELSYFKQSSTHYKQLRRSL